MVMGSGSKASRIERKTREDVSRAISSIEKSLAQWDSLKKKPKKLEERIRYLRHALKKLSVWEKRSLSGKRDPNSIAMRLRAFTEMQRDLSARRPD
jgi:hypothetical protein